MKTAVKSTLLKLILPLSSVFLFTEKKLNWTGDLALWAKAETVFKTKMDKLDPPTAPVPTSALSSAKGDDLFVSFGTTVEKEPETKQYLDAPVTLYLDSLNFFSKVRSLYYKTNTTLPSSAAVEHLFSCGGVIMTPLRTRVMDNNFESKVLLNFNKKLCF